MTYFTPHNFLLISFINSFISLIVGNISFPLNLSLYGTILLMSPSLSYRHLQEKFEGNSLVLGYKFFEGNFAVLAIDISQIVIQCFCALYAPKNAFFNLLSSSFDIILHFFHFLFLAIY